MTIRRRFTKALSLKNRLRIFANQLKNKAAKLRPGPEREDLLREARIADTASHINEWANSPGLQPPE